LAEDLVAAHAPVAGTTAVLTAFARTGIIIPAATGHDQHPGYQQ